MHSKVVAAFVVAVCCVAVPSAQSGGDQRPSATKQAPSSVTGQVKPADAAYQAAVRIKDPQARLAALQKFVVDFPQSSAVFAAAAQVRSLSIDAIAKATASYLDAEKTRLAAQRDEQGRCWEYFFAAVELERRDTLLAIAEKYARDGLAYWNGARREDPKMTVNGSDSFLRRADVQGLLGQILFKEGRLDEAEPLLRQAYDGRPTEMGFAVRSLPRLAEIAVARGRDGEALELMADTSLAGMQTADQREQFHALYRKAHGGTLDGLEQMLDGRYEATAPKIAVTPFQPSKRTGRTVLAEVFTGTGCGPCAGLDVAIDGAIARYARQDLVVLMHHLHIPSPDPFANAATEARQKFYGVQATPQMFVDGVEPDGFDGGGAPDKAADILRTAVDPPVQRALLVEPGARLSVRVTSRGQTLAVRVAADSIRPASARTTLHVALVEDRLRYSGRNGLRFHAMVIRAMAGANQAGFDVSGRRKVTIGHTFDLQQVSADLKRYLDDFETGRAPSGFAFDEKKDRVGEGRLAVVAFLQDETGKKVLQAAYAPAR